MEAPAILVGCVGFLTLLGRAYNVPSLYGNWMAPQTSIMFLLLSCGMLAAQRGESILRVLLEESAAGVVARRLMVATFLFVPITGFLKMKLDALGFNPQAATTFRVVLELLFFSVLIWRTTLVLQRLDRFKASSEQLLRQQDKLATLGRYAATVAHEINNPLQAVNYLIHVASGSTSPEDKAAFLESSKIQLARIANIVHSTLSLYREQSIATELPLMEVCGQLRTILQKRLDAQGVSIKLNIPDKLKVTAIRADLLQALTNLITNALDAIPIKTGVIRITGISGDGLGYSRIMVEDNGSGITAENKERIFEPFFSTKAEAGTGIGLWITKQLIEKNLGKLEVESAPGRTCFSITLPASLEVLPNASTSG